MDHFHLHCIIPAGVLSFDKTKWIAVENKYLFRIQSLAKEFRKRYLNKLEKAYEKNELRFYGRAATFAAVVWGVSSTCAETTWSWSWFSSPWQASHWWVFEAERKVAFQKLPDNKGMIYVPDEKPRCQNVPVLTVFLTSGAATNAAKSADQRVALKGRKITIAEKKQEEPWRLRMIINTRSWYACQSTLPPDGILSTRPHPIPPGW